MYGPKIVVTGQFNHFLKLFQISSNDEVDDSVRDMWKTIITDSNIPPLLTMPGLQSATELV